MKEEKYFKQHDDIINSNIPYGVDANSSPHIFINQWFHRIEKNSVVLRMSEEVQLNNQRKIFYEIDTVGENVRMNSKRNFYNLNVDGTKNNKIFIVTKFKDGLKVNKLSFVTESGNLIDRGCYDINNKGYILLATIQSEQILRNNKNTLSREDILIAKKFLRNQTESTKKDYHFGTSGHIFGFGYGPVYKSNEETKYTIDRFAKSKYIKTSLHFLIPS